MSDYILKHHGIKGQKWGRRRYQNEDGSLTDAGEKRYGGGVKGSAKLDKAREKQIYKEYRTNVVKKSATKSGSRTLATAGVGAGVVIGNAPLAGVGQYARRRIEAGARKSASREIEKKYGKQTMKSINDKQLRRDIAPVLASAAFMGMTLAQYYNIKKEG